MVGADPVHSEREQGAHPRRLVDRQGDSSSPAAWYACARRAGDRRSRSAARVGAPAPATASPRSRRGSERLGGYGLDGRRGREASRTKRRLAAAAPRSRSRTRAGGPPARGVRLGISGRSGGSADSSSGAARRVSQEERFCGHREGRQLALLRLAQRGSVQPVARRAMKLQVGCCDVSVLSAQRFASSHQRGDQALGDTGTGWTPHVCLERQPSERAHQVAPQSSLSGVIATVIADGTMLNVRRVGAVNGPGELAPGDANSRWATSFAKLRADIPARCRRSSYG